MTMQEKLDIWEERGLERGLERGKREGLKSFAELWQLTTVEGMDAGAAMERLGISSEEQGMYRDVLETIASR